DDRAGHHGIPQRPRDSYFARRSAVARADASQEFGEIEILRQQRFLIVRRAAAEVVCGHVGYTLAGHGAAEQTRLHRRVDDDSDIVGFAVRQDRVFDFGRDDAVGRLQRGDGRDLRDAGHLLPVEVADTDVADLAGLPQLFTGRPAFLDVFLGFRPVDLVEIDGIDVQTAEAVLAFFEDRGLFQTFIDDAIRSPAALALREDVRLV